MQLGNDVGEDDDQLREERKDPEDEVETQQSYPVELSKLAVEAGLHNFKVLTVAERGDRSMVSS